jgi:hypothetical protein
MTDQEHVYDALSPPPPAPRHHLPDTRRSVTRHTEISWFDRKDDGSPGKRLTSDLYLTVGLYENGSVAEVFARIDRAGSMLGQLVDAWVTAMSIGLQHGVPLESYLGKFRGMGAGAKFGEDYFTNDPRVPSCRGPVDYIAKRLALVSKGGE